MKRRALMMTGAGIGLALFGLFFSPMDRLIWNRTGSAPQGLYWLSDEHSPLADGSSSQPGALKRSGLRSMVLSVATGPCSNRLQAFPAMKSVGLAAIF